MSYELFAFITLINDEAAMTIATVYIYEWFKRTGRQNQIRFSYHYYLTYTIYTVYYTTFFWLTVCGCVDLLQFSVYKLTTIQEYNSYR